MKILFLYSELAQYFLDCVNILVEKTEVTVIHWPVNKEAPFKFKVDKRVKLLEKTENINLMDKISEVSPDAIFVAGWIDKEYIKAIGMLGDQVKRIISFDTSWKGSLKQRVGLIPLKIFVGRHFNYAFISGEMQADYAQKLGIPGINIYKGFYTAAVNQFEQVFKKRQEYPKTILFVARYVKHKGIFELWEAFIELTNEGFSDWKLVCAGTGDQWENRIEHPNIEHLGFVQPSEMEPMLLNASVYVLPSHVEPWGVSVHEMAAAGLPMILSHEVGSAEKFLVEGENGFSFPAKNKEALKEALLKMMRKPPEELAEMGSKSNQLAQSITPQKWVETVMKIVEY